MIGVATGAEGGGRIGTTGTGAGAGQGPDPGLHGIAGGARDFPTGIDSYLC